MAAATLSFPSHDAIHAVHATAGMWALFVASIGTVLAFLLYGVGVVNPAEIARQEDRQEENAIGATVDERLVNAIYLCPRCRELGKPTPDEALKQEFRRYKLPEAEAMQQALDDEYKRSRAARVREHGGGNPS